MSCTPHPAASNRLLCTLTFRDLPWLPTRTQYAYIAVLYRQFEQPVCLQSEALQILLISVRHVFLSYSMYAIYRGLYTIMKPHKAYVESVPLYHKALNNDNN